MKVQKLLLFPVRRLLMRDWRRVNCNSHIWNKFALLDNEAMLTLQREAVRDIRASDR